MAVISNIFSRSGYNGLRAAKILRNAVKKCTSFTNVNSVDKSLDNKTAEQNFKQNKIIPSRYRYTYPEFLPDPDPKYRNLLREKLERMDMLARRAHINIPEFYVGSILSVTYSEPHAPGKVNKFIGICIERKGCGLRATFQLRNVVDGYGVEVLYELYDPAIQKIECLRLEKRLDPHLRYLRDAPLDYSTFPFDMEPEYLVEGAPVPINEMKVKLNPFPWVEKWELQDLKGVEKFELYGKRLKRAEAFKKPWEKYDLMKIYRSTVPEEDQNEIFNEVYTKLHELEITRRRQKHKRAFVRPQKTA
ncbi:39S ribosomal protein L19, mitochondrial isoform X2 [Harpegnathos saltator]|uniref:39S ribosomal protein L19, mitochondrial isoform X2 n=1 Tax=Harpegnathos saltator TaxID=610380 RepID=UPI0005910D9F|nr:39S ribosomal protein L19, mitochondrial isoform X2 [Harpegnathos saltator]